MPNYRRARTAGGTYFFTVVAYLRQQIFVDDDVINEFRNAVKEVKQKYLFQIDAWVLLPDHMHCIWTLPKDDYAYSKRMGMIKANFTSRVKHKFERNELLSESKTRKRESTIWQRRFWEHEIRDDKDFQRHIDYIHYNPVKHGCVKNVVDWPFSTFHRFVEKGVYLPNWAGIGIEESKGFGE